MTVIGTGTMIVVLVGGIERCLLCGPVHGRFQALSRPLLGMTIRTHRCLPPLTVRGTSGSKRLFRVIRAVPALLVLHLLLFGTTLRAQTYCWPSHQMACFYGDKITRVTFADLDHTDNACSEDAHGKKDFTGSIAAGNIVAGETYSLAVTVENSFSSGTERLRAWIDLDQNGVFASEESIDLGTATGNATLTVDVNIPLDAATGMTRIRVMYRRTASNPLNAGDACHSYGSYRGQVKDYALLIEPPSTLPVELLSFALHDSGEGVQLDWATASETNSASFAVQHSSDAWHWETLTVLPAAGHSNVILLYGYTHTPVMEGVHYYRLQQTDLDGKTKYLPVRGISVKRFDQPVAYPNPCAEHIRIRVDGGTPWSVVHPASSQVIPVTATLHGTNEWELDTRSLPSGIHLIHLHEHGRLHAIPFIKQ